MEKTNKKKPVEYKKQAIKDFMIWMIIGIILISISNCIYINKGNKVTYVKLVATAEKNDKALSNNIRLNRIVLDKGTDKEREYDLSRVNVGGAWKYDEENHLLYAYELDNKAELNIPIMEAESIDINFISEVGSGKVQVYINDELKNSIDLYSDSEWRDFNREYTNSFAEYYALNILICFLLLVGLWCIFKVAVLNNINELKIYIKTINRFRILKAAAAGGTLVVLYLLISTVLADDLYAIIKKDNVVLTIESTGEKNSKAAYNTVRVSRIFINDVAYDFSKVATTNAWDYDGINNFIYLKDNTKPVSFDLVLNNIRTIDINFVSERGSGIANVYINNKKIETIDLYQDAKWAYKRVHYHVNPLVTPHKGYGVITVIFLIGLIIGLFNENKNKDEKGNMESNAWAPFFINLCLSFIICYIVSSIQYESFWEGLKWIICNQSKFWPGFAIVTILNMILYFISRRNSVSFGVLSIIMIIMLTVNYLKLNFRDIPLLPWDFLLISVAMTVLDNFELKFPRESIVCLILTIAVIILLVRLEKKEGVLKLRVGFRIPIAIMFTGVLVYSVISNYYSSGGANLFSPKDYYEEKGFINAFIRCTEYLLPIEEPENYNEDTMNAIYEEVEQVTSGYNEGEKPNIIVLMSESFWDLERIDKIKFNEEMFPTYRKLQETAVTGQLLTNVFGGGTVNTEFEAITGFSVGYLPQEYMPYQRCVRDDFFSINKYLKNQGYESSAMHPFKAENYNRDTAYNYLDFDKKIWEDDFEQDCDRMRSYVSDKALVERIISEYEEHNSQSASPWFNLSVSMQNHGGYWGSCIDEDKDLDIDVSEYDESSQGSIMDLAIGLHYADLALGELIEYFEDQEEPTVIIMFGDHMSDAGPIGITLLGQSDIGTAESSPEQIYNRHIVPFMAWSNYGNENIDCGTIGVTQLLPTVFDIYNVNMPKYFKYLRATQNIYTGAASNIAVNSDGSYNYISDMSEKQKEQYDKYWLIEYDYIFGENYLKRLFES